MNTSFIGMQNARDALALLWNRLIPPRMGSVEEDLGVITLDYLFAMPKRSRLLVAHFVEQRNPNVTLLAGDTDVHELLLSGWLDRTQCSTEGAVCFKFEPFVWSELMSLRSEILNGDLTELENYRKRKTAIYPWVW